MTDALDIILSLDLDLESIESLIDDLAPVVEGPECLDHDRLHLGHVKLLARGGKDDVLVKYTISHILLFSNHKEWMLLVHQSLTQLKQSPPVVSLNLQVKCQICYLSLWEGADMKELLNQFQQDIIISSRLFKGESELQDWLLIRQEMVSCLELFQGVLSARQVSLPINRERDLANILKSLESLSLSLSFISGSSHLKLASFRRHGMALCTMKRLLSTLNLHWVFESEGKIFKLGHAGGSFPFKSSLCFPPAFEFVEGDRELVEKHLHDWDMTDRKEMAQFCILQCCWSLVEVVELLSWQAHTGNLRECLIHLFPSLDVNHLVVEKVASTFTKKSFRTEYSKTPTIADLEAFILLLILERQVFTLQQSKPESSSLPQFIFSQMWRWRPSENASKFWSYLVSTFSSVGKRLFSKVLASKIIQKGLAEIRGTLGYGLRIPFGLIGSAFSQLSKENKIDGNLQSNFYINLYENYHVQDLEYSSHLFSQIFGELEKLMQVDMKSHIAKARADSLVIFTAIPGKSEDIAEPETHKLVSASKRVSFAKVESVSQIESNEIPGFFPKTPIIKKPSTFDTPELLKSVPGYFPKTPVPSSEIPQSFKFSSSLLMVNNC